MQQKKKKNKELCNLPFNVKKKYVYIVLSLTRFKQRRKILEM